VNGAGEGPRRAAGFPSRHRYALRTHRPWGWFETLDEGEGYLVKRLRLEPGCRLSLQRHRHRREHWVIAAGRGSAELDGVVHPLEPGSTLFIPCGAVHRAAAAGAPLTIIEVQHGSVLREDDIERFADDYGRVPAPG
jgi:mannose-6-phosphate isomerase-like protein (cupin superfamily)